MAGPSAEFGEQLTDFTNETKRQTNAPITPFLQSGSFDPKTFQAISNASYDVRGAWVEQPGRRHDPISC
jgi:hypothetical protein